MWRVRGSGKTEKAGTTITLPIDFLCLCRKKLFSTENGLKIHFLGGTRFRSCHFGGSWRPNRLRQVNFWGTPEMFGT